MVLGIYYITKISGVTETGKPKPGSDIWDDINNGSVSFDKSLVREDGKGLKPAYTFYGPEEAIIAYNEGRVDMIPVHHYSILFKEGNAIRKGMPITNGAIFPSISAEVDSIEKGKDGLTEIHLRKRYSIQDLYRILANDGEHLRAGAAIADQVVKSGIDGEVIISENEQYGLQITVSSDTMKTSPVPKGAVIMRLQPSLPL
jgi:hypothetical protein